MAKTRNLLSRVLGRLGDAIFHFLTMLEEKGVMPRGTRWIKLSTLGIITSLVAALSLQARDPEVTCYIVARIPDVIITDKSVTPDTTKGADSVKVKAQAKVMYSNIKDNFIKDAWLSWDGDTTRIKVRALDGKMDDTLEVLEGTVYVGNRPNGQNSISMIVETSVGALESSWFYFVVSEPDSATSDSTGEK